MSITRRERGDGSVAYQVRVYVRGRRLSAETFPTLKEARRREGELLGRAFIGTRETCDVFARRWIDDYPISKTGPTRGRRKSAGTNATNRYYLEHFIREFRGIRLEELDRPMARRFASAYPRSAAVARNVFADALDDGLVQHNPFASMHIEQRPGRRDHGALIESEFQALAGVAQRVHPGHPQFAALVLFASYSGGRLNETLNLEWDDIDYANGEVTFRVAKFDKPRTVLLLPEAAEALKSIPRNLKTPLVFTNKTGRHGNWQLSSTNHYAIWNPVRHAFWNSLTDERRKELVDLDWHSLRHACGFHFYVTLGFTDEETAAQLGHADAALVRNLYGHARQGVLERMKAKLRKAA